MTLVDRVRELAQWWQRELDSLTEIREDDSLLVRIARTLVSVDARDRVLALAGQAFIALIPLVIVLATAFSSADGAAVGNFFVERFELEGAPATAMHALFSRPPEATSGIGVAAIVILLFSLNSYGRSVAKTFERTWGLPRAKGARRLLSLAGVFVLVANTVVLNMLSLLVRRSPPRDSLLLIGLDLLLGAVMWLALIWLFLSGRRALETLVPAALCGAAVQLVASVAMSVYLPRFFAVSTQRYGVIGVSFALVSYMVVIGVVTVVVAIVGAELAREVEQRQHRPGQRLLRWR
jgi:membrane protein